MLSLSNISIVDTLKKIQYARNGDGLDVTFLVPTKTGYTKSIMDATKEVRSFLLKKGVHNYDMQLQGQDHKVSIRTTVFSKDAIKETLISLYRPETKGGDPRIWVKGLKKLAEPTDLLAIGQTIDGLVVINCSKTNLDDLLNVNNSTFWNLFSSQRFELNDRATELLSKLKDIGGRGFIKTLRPGDTGVGFTLETLLGIQANSSKKPDYKGIELKSARNRGRRGNRTTIFSKVPNWKKSRLKGTKYILKERGYYVAVKKRLQLFHSFSTAGPNSLGMYLRIDDDNLYQDYVDPINGVTNDVQWELDVLRHSFLSKHQETFWVYADVNGRGANEEFRYSQAKYTSGPDENRLILLLASGTVTIDYTIKGLSNGSAKDQGYLFKIKPDDLELLFSTPREYSLI